MTSGTIRIVLIRIAGELRFLYTSIAFIQGPLILVLSLARRYIDVDIRVIKCGRGPRFYY